MTGRTFWHDDQGQDLIEYTLLLALFCVMSAAMMAYSGSSMGRIWHVTDNNLSAARSVVARER